MVSAKALEAFNEYDVELTVPPGQPRPILIIVMVCRSEAFPIGVRDVDTLLSVGSRIMVSDPSPGTRLCSFGSS